MNTPDTEMQTYPETIDGLKRRSQRLKRAGVGLLQVTGVLLLAGEVRLAGVPLLVLGGAMLLLRIPLSNSRFNRALGCSMLNQIDVHNLLQSYTLGRRNI